MILLVTPQSPRSRKVQITVVANLTLAPSGQIAGAYALGILTTLGILYLVKELFWPKGTA